MRKVGLITTKLRCFVISINLSFVFWIVSVHQSVVHDKKIDEPEIIHSVDFYCRVMGFCDGILAISDVWLTKIMYSDTTDFG